MRIQSKSSFLNAFYPNNMYKPFEFSKNNWFSYDNFDEAYQHIQLIKTEISLSDITKEEKEILLKKVDRFKIVN